MKKIATKYEINKEKAYMVGLLHDISRELGIDKIKELAIKFNNRDIIKIDELEKKLKTPMLLHGAASSEILAEELGSMDNEILEAIYYHTLGGENISNLAKLIYIVDFCEPKRDYKEASLVRKILLNKSNSHGDGFLLAYYFSYYYSIKLTLKSYEMFYKDTINGYNSVLTEIEKRGLVINKELI
jgi:predicted HD superfamily hydrolase involved in NAD metabolism